MALLWEDVAEARYGSLLLNVDEGLNVGRMGWPKDHQSIKRSLEPPVTNPCKGRLRILARHPTSPTKPQRTSAK